MRGSHSSHLASTTFCWLPPDRVDTGSAGSLTLMRSFRIMAVTPAASRARSTTMPRDKPGRAASVMLAATDMGSISPSVLRSSGISAMPARLVLAAPGLVIARGAPSTATAPDTPRSTPNSASSRSRWPCPSSPPSPTISPGPTRRSTPCSRPAQAMPRASSAGVSPGR